MTSLRIACALVVLLSSPLAAEDPVLQANTITLLSGPVQLDQTFGGDTSSTKLDAQVLLVTEPGPSKDALVLRSVRKLLGEDGLILLGKGQISTSGRYEDSDVPFELEDTQSSADLYLQFLPRFDATTAGTTAEETLSVLNISPVTARFQRQKTMTADTATLARKMTSKDVSFKFQGSPAKLLAWNETIVVSRKSGTIKSSTRSVRLVVTIDAGEVELHAHHKLTATTTLAGAEAAAKVQAASQALEKLDAQFEKIPASATLQPGVEAFTKNVAVGPLAILGEAVQGRFDAFKALFEGSPQGRLLAELLHRKSPDFELKGLDDKSHKFSELSKGKVTLLSFWGFG